MTGKNIHRNRPSEVFIPTYNTEEEPWMDIKWKQKVAKNIFKFIDELPAPICDLGKNNPKKMELERLIKLKINSVYGMDFDYEAIPEQWGTIFCFEILEHLFNPLFFLENLKDALKPNGVIYLSTPGRPHFLWTEHHFHEIDNKRIFWLFNRAGLQVEKIGKYRLYRGWRWHLRGIRPLIRIFTYSRIYKLKKN